MKWRLLFVGIVISLLIAGCGKQKHAAVSSDDYPAIFPDYIGVTIPKNIAPLNFGMEGATDIHAVLETSDYRTEVRGGRYVDIDPDEWRGLVESALEVDGKIKVRVEAWTDKQP